MLWNAKNGEVAIGNGRMSYVRFGRGAQKLVILPGLSDGLATVKGKALLLAGPYRPFFNQFTIYMFSRRDELPSGHSIRDMAADQAEAMDKLHLRSASVLGVSQGGMIAQYLAIDHPKRVERLVLAVTAPRANGLVRANVKDWIGFAERGRHRELMIATTQKSYSPEYLKKYRKIYPVIGLVGRPSSYDRFLENARAILSFDAASELDAVTCPTLIIGGEQDRVVGVQASHELHERIAGSELFIYPGLGHAAYEEARDFNRRVFGFIGGVR